MSYSYSPAALHIVFGVFLKVKGFFFHLIFQGGVLSSYHCHFMISPRVHFRRCAHEEQIGSHTACTFSRSQGVSWQLRLQNAVGENFGCHGTFKRCSKSLMPGVLRIGCVPHCFTRFTFSSPSWTNKYAIFPLLSFLSLLGIELCLPGWRFSMTMVASFVVLAGQLLMPGVAYLCGDWQILQAVIICPLVLMLSYIW